MVSIRWIGATVAVFALAALMGGCGGADAGPSPGPETARGEHADFPVTVEGANGDVAIQRAPRRIVSLSPTATEVLFAIGAGGRVVAVDDQSNYPRRAPRTRLSGLAPNLEALADYRPDFVVVEDDGPSDVVDGLERLGVAVLAQTGAESLADAYSQIRELGIATGRRDRAAVVVDRMRSRIERLLARVPDGPRLAVFHELSPDLYTASSDTFIGRIYERLGLRNIADRAAARAGNAYPQLSPEAVVAADPDIVVLADTDCCSQTAATVQARTGWDAVSAVADGGVVAVDDDVASRWGPRIPQFVERIVEAIEKVRGQVGDER